MANSVEHLQAMRAQLQSILEHLPRFGVSTERLPIIDILEHDNDNINEDGEEDSSATGSASGKSTPNGSRERADGASRERTSLRHPQTGIPGLRIFRDNVRNDIGQIDKFLARHAQHRTTVSASAFSTNAPYLIAIWNELVNAKHSIVAVDKSFPARLEEKKPPKSKPVPPLNTFSRKGILGAKVDIVCDGGRHWIRVNTIRNSRLLTELRELDSYLTDSETEEGDHRSANCNCRDSSCKAKPVPDELDNSLLQMGKQLIAAAHTSVAESGGNEPPKVTLRLTRLLLNTESLEELEPLGLKTIGCRERSITSKPSEIDPRIAQTLRELLQMGLEIILGEHEFTIPGELRSPSSKPLPQLVPSQQINLDLSVLIALVSDITHAPLPPSTEEAYTRYIPTAAERARSRKRRQHQKELLARSKAQSALQNLLGRSQNKTKGKVKAPVKQSTDNSESDGEGESVHSKALASQVLKEIDQGLLEEIATRLNLPPGTSLDSSGVPHQVEFWTSKEVRDRCLRIVDKIGGPAEKRRAAALFFDPSKPKGAALGMRFSSAQEAVEAYWRDSRHPQNMIRGLVPLRIFKDEVNSLQVQTASSGITVEENPFWTNLETACTRLLSEGSTHHPRVASLFLDPSSSSSSSQTYANHVPSTISEHGEDDVHEPGEIERAAVTRSNPRLTAHTVDTLQRGVKRRWTTLTANRASVRKMLKESVKVKDASTLTSIPNVSSVAGRIAALELEDRGECDGVDGDETEVAAIWVVEPRSLAESMRGDFMQT
ncbi:hypothetical protein ACEPAH_2935 [Sanghuangporus vaninii]